MPLKRNKKYKAPATPLTVQEKVSRYMRGNKAKNTKPELLLRKALWQADLRGYRVHWPKAPGKPDICYPSRKLAIFIHGCFWHRCPYCQPALPKTNADFWKEKFKKNVERDQKYKRLYRDVGWHRFIVWECQLEHGLSACVSVIKELHKGVPESWQVAA